jgi:hypothetical protein
LRERRETRHDPATLQRPKAVVSVLTFASERRQQMRDFGAVLDLTLAMTAGGTTEPIGAASLRLRAKKYILASRF